MVNKILDMQFIRYANLFGKITKIRTNHCFFYNNAIVFAVPRKLVARAIGPENSNLKRLNQALGKKVKIVAIPNGREDIENFVSVITYPVKCAYHQSLYLEERKRMNNIIQNYS